MKKKIFAIALLSTLMAPALAENMYGALSLGSAFDNDLAGFGQTSNDMSYNLMLGYKINKNFAAEIGYSSFLSDAGVANTVATTETADGFEAAGIGMLPFNDKLAVFGRLGYANLSAKYSLNGAVGRTEYLSGLVYGAGVQFDINKQIGVRVGYNIYNTQGSRGDSIINNTYASALYNF